MTEERAARVLMLSPSFYPHLGGAEKQALELSKRLSVLGARVGVLTRRLPGLAAQEEIGGIAIRRVFCAGTGLVNSLTFLGAVFIRLILSRGDYDVVHVHLAGSPALAACLAGRLLGKKVVVKIGGGRGIGEIAASSRTFPGRIKLALLRRLAPVFIAVAEDLRREMLEAGMSGDIRVIPNGVDIVRYRPATRTQKEALREPLGWGRGLRFLYVGRLAREKRLEAFIEAFAAAADGEARLMLVGAGPEEERLKEAVRERGLGNRVLLRAPEENIARVYASADVFVLPSVSEGLSNALLEAMASGLAVLASRVGGTPEAVEDGETGILFDPRDAKAAAAGIRKFISEPELARRFGAAAREDAVSRYSLERVAKRYLEIYH